jgi:transcriptional regulator with XRE-family HTH domain
MLTDKHALRQLRYHLEISRNALSEYTDIPEKRLESIERGESNVTPQELFTLIDFMFDRKPQRETAIVRN